MVWPNTASTSSEPGPGYWSDTRQALVDASPYLAEAADQSIIADSVPTWWRLALILTSPHMVDILAHLLSVCTESVQIGLTKFGAISTEVGPNLAFYANQTSTEVGANLPNFPHDADSARV